MARRFLPPLMLLAWLVAPSFAVDLTKVDRTIVKEPSYKSKPKYCLLVFGPEAKTRVWLVQDGDTLYVDRDGNGDLTAPGKKVEAEKQKGEDDGGFAFKAGEIREGSLVHKDLNVFVSKIDHLAKQDDMAKGFLAKNPKARGYYIMVETEMPGWHGSGVGGRVRQRAFYLDANGVLQFADKPQEAPIVHFGGPWQISLFGAHKLTIGRETDVVLGVGSPGIGPGTTTWIDYDGVIPEKVYPTVEVTYTPKQAGAAPITERYELKRRC
jgi:hypothetical protein